MWSMPEAIEVAWEHAYPGREAAELLLGRPFRSLYCGRTAAWSLLRVRHGLVQARPALDRCALQGRDRASVHGRPHSRPEASGRAWQTDRRSGPDHHPAPFGLETG